MVKTKRIILIILLAFIAVISLTVGGVFAYFSATTRSDSSTLSTSITDDGFVVEISDFSDLFTASKAEYWSDLSEVSTTAAVTYNSTTTTDENGNETTTSATVSTSRKVIKLGADVTLENDLKITADVHIDLNGHTLNLNGYTLTIEHSYAGTFLLYDGATTKGGIISYTKETDEAASTTVTSDGATVNITLSDGTAIAVTTATTSATVTVTDETAPPHRIRE